MALGPRSLVAQMPPRRQLAAMVASRLGVLRAIRQTRLQAGLLVLAYHRIGEAAGCAVDEQLFSHTPDGLSAHVRMLKRWSRLCPLDEVVGAYHAGRFTEPMSLLTFDDVYRDNYETVFPLLRSLGVPGVFFVPTGLIEQRHVPWWDRIAYAVKHSRVEECTLLYPTGLSLSGIRSAPGQARLKLLRRLKADADLDQERYLTGIEEAVGASALGAPEVGELFCDWRQLREMAEGGMALESHTHTHRLLGHLPYQEQREELARSREVLREKVGTTSRAVAYPVGARNHFNTDTRRAMEELGYALGFSNYGGWNAAPEDPCNVRRLAVDAGITPAMLQASLTLPRMFNPESPIRVGL
jgi:peptidoglycan/xylan/chitin deacetylase (PgdA/CDA1 family)